MGPSPHVLPLADATPLRATPPPHRQALAFIFRRKRGALLGLSRERAFVVARKDDGEGGTAWSGPVFCKGGTLSLGLTAGGLRMPEWSACVVRQKQAGRSVAVMQVLRGRAAPCRLKAWLRLRAPRAAATPHARRVPPALPVARRLAGPARVLGD